MIEHLNENQTSVALHKEKKIAFRRQTQYSQELSFAQLFQGTPI